MTLISHDDNLTAGAWAACGKIDEISFGAGHSSELINNLELLLAALSNSFRAHPYLDIHTLCLIQHQAERCSHIPRK